MVDLRAIRREPDAARAALGRRRDGSEERLDAALALDAPHGAILWERRGRVMEEPGDCSVCSPP